MTTFQKVSLFILRITLGWLFFYSGITKVLNPNWSAAGYLQGAKTFHSLYAFFLLPEILPITNFLNEWGLTLVGIALILGICVRVASISGILLMILYYLPILQFPYPNPQSFIVDQHIIFSVALLILMAFKAGRAWGLEEKLTNFGFFAKYPKLKGWLF